MRRITFFACLLLLVTFAVNASAGNDDQRIHFRKALEAPQVASPAGAAKDSCYLIGGFGNVFGHFEDIAGTPDWQGWTHEDLTLFLESNWNVSTYHAVAGTYSAWCGDMIAVCDENDEVGGYGNNWSDWLDYRGTVPNPDAATTVTVSAMCNIDTEPAYDFVRLQYNSMTGFQDVNVWDGFRAGLAMNETFSVATADYQGPEGDQIHLRWEFTSDGGWSDEDCIFASVGAIQLDNVDVSFNGTSQGVADFESGTLDEGWEPAYPEYVGDFAQLYSGLEDVDPCRSNSTWQVVFIDDGLVVPGTGGSQCTTWCYGPNGYIVNTEGGLAGPDFHIDNAILSPVLPWTCPDNDGAQLQFGVYRHETLSDTSPGIFYVWEVRSTNGAEEDIEDAAWVNRNFVEYGGPNYFRHTELVTDLMEPGRTYVQIRLRCFELGWNWGWNGTDGYPAPYFDNVFFVNFLWEGPGISTREIDMFQDNFPESGDINYSDLSANWVRVDGSQNIAPAAQLREDAADSAVWNIQAVRAGSVLEGTPVVHYKLDPNPLYNPYRGGTPLEGEFPGVAINATRYSFDMPDTGFFFPGDVIHYFIKASDNVGGVIGTTTMPADTTGFSDFSDPLGYRTNFDTGQPTSFTIRALPTMHSSDPTDQPPVLLWNDLGGRGGENEWTVTMRNLGMERGEHYDIFYTNGPTSGVGNGLGGRATTAQIANYETILYTSGNLGVNTISNGDYANDSGDDVGLLDNFLQLGNKNMFMCGDELAFDMSSNGGDATATFLSYWVSVDFQNQVLNTLIDNQIAPMVRTFNGNSVFTDGMEWIAFGGCLGINQFDAVVTLGDAESLAEFLTPQGTGGQYPYAAATYYNEPTYNAEVIYMPYDFIYIYTPDNASNPGAPLSLRTQVLQQALMQFGHTGGPNITNVPDAGAFTAKSYPNPFNPSAWIEYNMPQRGQLSIKVFNVRGELIRTLVDEVREAGSDRVMWNGRNDQGASVASGVYFYEVNNGNQTLVNKMTMLK